MITKNRIIALLQERNTEELMVRAYAVMLAGILKLKEFADSISVLRNDNSIVIIYNNGEFQNIVIGEIAEKIYRKIDEAS